MGDDGRVFLRYTTSRKGHITESWAKTMDDYLLRSNRMKVLRNRHNGGQFRKAGRVASALLSHCKERAKDRGGVVTIDHSWIKDRLERGVSELTGVPLVIPANKTTHSCAPSIDRIDRADPNYSPSNSRVITFQENMALGPFTEAESLPNIEALYVALKQRHGTSNIGPSSILGLK